MEANLQPVLETRIARTKEPVLIENKAAIIKGFGKLNGLVFNGRHYTDMDTLLAVAAAGHIRNKRPVPQAWFISKFDADAHEFHTLYKKAFPEQCAKYVMEDYLGYYAGVFSCDFDYAMKLYRLNGGLKGWTPNVGAAAILCAASPSQEYEICSALGTTMTTITRKKLILCRD